MDEEKSERILAMLENIEASLLRQRKPKYLLPEMLLTTIFSGVLSYFLYRILEHHFGKKRK